MPFTVNKKLSVQAAGTNSAVWGAGSTGNDLNTGVIAMVDTIVAGLSTISLSSSNYNLTFVSGGGGDVSNCMLRFTGTLLANIIVSPAGGDATTYFNGFYLFENLTSGAFSVTLQNAAGSIVLPQSRRGMVFVDGTNGPRMVSVQSLNNLDNVPSGSNMLFKQASVPTGWTQDTSINDYGMRIVSGTGNVGHGVTAFSTVFNQTATGSYTLQIADIPSHTHDVKYTVSPSPFQSSGGNIPVISIGSGGSSTGSGAAVATGGGGAHSHSISLQPLYVDLITGTRN